MRKTTVGAAAVAAALIASLTLAAGGTATATTASGRGLRQTGLPVAVDPAAGLTPNADPATQSWYVTAHVRAGGHRYGFMANYLTSGDAKQGTALSSVSIINEDTGWHTKSELALTPRTGLSDKQGVDIHTDNITWTGDTKEQKLRAKVPEGTIDVTFHPRGNVLYNMGTGYFPMFGDAKYPNYEYAFPTMDTSGTLTLGGRTDKVSGKSWLDRQWGPLPDVSTGKASWSWTNLDLSNGDEISLWKTKESGKQTTWATVLKPDGTHTLAEATLTPDQSTLWTSPHTGKKYPTRWKITIPGEHAKLNVKVYANDQELTVPGPRYEGSAAVTGTYDHHPVTGTTYVELTGGQ
ncbi:lipocalin family protein [Streptomyces sasae]|uniref:lipocalin family protein n=1 Tax=Streptomyces sasae TaxID=1266772 RepID=UPI002930168F|nr:lipocalin family protein [Streptomyces sasae]